MLGDLVPEIDLEDDPEVLGDLVPEIDLEGEPLDEGLLDTEAEPL